MNLASLSLGLYFSIHLLYSDSLQLEMNSVPSSGIAVAGTAAYPLIDLCTPYLEFGYIGDSTTSVLIVKL